jgi:Uncharacterised nucleotidyltransferase
MALVHKESGRPEHELLLLCARTSVSESVVSRLRHVAEAEIDWDYLFQLARRHSVVPLIYTQLRDKLSDLVPHEHLTRFKENYQENVARNLVLTSELERIISSLSAVGVQAVPFKGPVLTLFAYNDLALRRFVDLDVIVRKIDVFKARDVLRGLKYGVSKTVTSDQEELLLSTQHSVQFQREDGRMLVELHTEVASHLFASSVTAEDLWRNLIRVQLNNLEVNSLSAEDLLFSLSVHGSRHLWERLSWICDVAELINRYDLDWSSLMTRAAKTDCERMFYLGPFLAESFLETELPPEVKARLEHDSLLKSFARGIRERLFNGPEHVPATTGQIFRYNVGLRKSWRARARYLVYALRPTDGDVGAFSLPKPFNFAYYLIRPVRLLVSK